MGFHFPFLGVSEDEHNLSGCSTVSSMPRMHLDSTSVTVFFMKDVWNVSSLLRGYLKAIFCMLTFLNSLSVFLIENLND